MSEREPAFRPIRVVSTGRYVPTRIVTAAEVDQKLGVESGWTDKHTGVRERRVEDTLTCAEMGARAAKEALSRAKLKVADIDLVINASASFDQPIPCGAVLLMEELGANHGAMAFDVNSTCASFLVALDTASAMLMAGGRIRRALIVSSEKPNTSVNPKHPESYALFGDVAAACIIELDPAGKSQLMATRMEAYPEGRALCEMRAGGMKKPPSRWEEHEEDDKYFDMKGPALVKMSLKKLPAFVERLFAQGTGFTVSDLDWFVPHQASLPALEIVRRVLNVSPERYVITADRFGNNVAASLPLALDEIVSTGKLRRGQSVLLLGTAAGFSMAGTLLRY